MAFLKNTFYKIRVSDNDQWELARPIITTKALTKTKKGIKKVIGEVIIAWEVVIGEKTIRYPHYMIKPYNSIPLKSMTILGAEEELNNIINSSKSVDKKTNEETSFETTNK